MIDHRLDPTLSDRAKAADLDWRNAWVGPDGRGEVRAWPAEAATALGVPRLDRTRRLCTTTPLEPVRREPRHAAEMITEVRAAEELTGLVQDGPWWLVSGEDGYVGWIHEWVLADSTPLALPVARFARPLGTLWMSDHHAATPLWTGMPLWAVEGPAPEREGHRLLRTATGAEGWLGADELRGPEALAGPRELLNLLRGLVGTPYRWGGRSPLGFDCSGLVQFAAQLSGALLPRDASQQARVGEEVDPAEVSAGDLLFFGDPADHVGFSDGRGGLLHCQGRVRSDRLERLDALRPRLSGARRWWGLRGRSAASAWTAAVADA